MNKEKDFSFLNQETINVSGEDLQNMETLKTNQNNQNRDLKNDDGKTESKKENDTDNKDDIKIDLVRIIEENKNSYFKMLDKYKNKKNYNICNELEEEHTEVNEFVVKDSIHFTNYTQYIDVYEDVTNAEEDIEKEEVMDSELPQYVEKYESKIETEKDEKTIEIPSYEEIKKPIYNTVDIPYIIPNIVENDILVVLKKIIQPEIEFSNDILEVEVEKYVPRLVPINVYVPRYFGISPKVKGSPEESVRYVNLSKEQVDKLIKELNPHFDELKVFNENQLKRMAECIKESQKQAKEHNFEPPKPQFISYDENGKLQCFDYSEFDNIKDNYLKESIH